MESYEDLRLEKKDKILKLSFFERLLKRDNRISEQNLDFLEERYQQSDSTLQNPLQDINKNSRHLQTSLQEENAQMLIHTGLNVEEREAILKGMDLNTKEIPFKMVVVTFCLMAFVLVLFIPKIYIRNNIYYASRNIIQLQAQIDSLREENKHIKKQLEDIKFKNLTQELDF